MFALIVCFAQIIIQTPAWCVLSYVISYFHKSAIPDTGVLRDMAYIGIDRYRYLDRYMYIYIYIYMYREREREMHMCIHILVPRSWGGDHYLPASGVVLAADTDAEAPEDLG